MKEFIYRIIRSFLRPVIVWLLRKPDDKNGVVFYLPSSVLIDSAIGANSKINIPYQISNVTIGDYSYVSKNSEISFTTIGKFCSIGPNFFCGWGIHPIDGISTSPMFYSKMIQNGISVVRENKIEERKRIVIGNDVFIGANVTILDGVTIGDGAVIGAGSVVSKNIPPYSIAYGVPIQIVRKRFDDNIVDKMLLLKWWDRPELIGEIEKNFFQVNNFVDKFSKNEQ